MPAPAYSGVLENLLRAGGRFSPDCGHIPYSRRANCGFTRHRKPVLVGIVSGAHWRVTLVRFNEPDSGAVGLPFVTVLFWTYGRSGPFCGYAGSVLRLLRKTFCNEQLSDSLLFRAVRLEAEKAQNSHCTERPDNPGVIRWQEDADTHPDATAEVLSTPAPIPERAPPSAPGRFAPPCTSARRQRTQPSTPRG